MMTKKTKKRIWSFWKGNLSKREAQGLLESLDHERSVMQELFERRFQNDQQEKDSLTPEQSHQILQTIRAKAGIETTPVKKIYRYKWGVAAAVLCLFGVISLLYRSQYSLSVDPAGSVTAATQPTALYVLESGANAKQYILGDGSTLLLSPYSTVAYDRDYGVSNRTIRLTGEGRFVVKRDSLLPFEVTSNGFTTTALGTEFIVNGRDTHLTKVELLHGKVVVRSTGISRMQITETFLKVGDKLSINTQTKAVAFVQAPKGVVAANPVAGIPRVAATEQASSVLNFQKTALTEVFHTIADRFEIRVDVNASELNSMTFTGTFSEEDRVETILAIICRINSLIYERTSETSFAIHLAGSTASDTHIILDTVKN